MIGILGKKIGMTRIIGVDGKIIPTTIVKCDSNIITQHRTVEKNGYNAIVVSFGPIKNPTKTKKFYQTREFKTDNLDGLDINKTFDTSIFSLGDKIQFSGTSKGKGFQGVMKKWKMHGGPASHGSHFHREPGSVGARAKPGKIHRGKKLPGRMGNQTITRNSEIVYIDTEKSLIGIKGPLPGAINSYIKITKLSTRPQ